MAKNNKSFFFFFFFFFLPGDKTLLACIPKVLSTYNCLDVVRPPSFHPFILSPIPPFSCQPMKTSNLHERLLEHKIRFDDHLDLPVFRYGILGTAAATAGSAFISPFPPLPPCCRPPPPQLSLLPSSHPPGLVPPTTLDLFDRPVPDPVEVEPVPLSDRHGGSGTGRGREPPPPPPPPPPPTNRFDRDTSSTARETSPFNVLPDWSPSPVRLPALRKGAHPDASSSISSLSAPSNIARVNPPVVDVPIEDPSSSAFLLFRGRESEWSRRCALSEVERPPIFGMFAFEYPSRISSELDLFFDCRFSPPSPFSSPSSSSSFGTPFLREASKLTLVLTLIMCFTYFFGRFICARRIVFFIVACEHFKKVPRGNTSA